MTVTERAIPNSSDIQVTIDTTTGATSYQLPSGFFAGRSVRVRHSKGSTDATITVASGGSIDDTVNGTLTLGVDKQVLIEAGDGNAWQSYGSGNSLTSLDARYVQGSRQVIAGTGLTGGGDLSADRTLAVAYGTTSTTATVGNDSRFATLTTDVAARALITENVNVVAAAGASQTIPAPTSYTQNKYTLTAATCTFTLPTAVAGQSFSVSLAQDGTGGRLAVFTSAKWAGGVAPTLSTGASKIDDLTFQCTDVSVGWKGYIAGLDMR